MLLANLTVIDIATLGAAPQIATFFGDFGARVIKVEHPRGDGLRRLVDRTGVALQWQLTNRNKQCVTLDLTQVRGRDLLERMLARTDVLVSALSRARLARWALDPVELRTRHPRLVLVNLTAYGSDGPWGDRPGSGTLAEAMSGLAALTGPADRPPTLSPVGLGDTLGAMQGIIAALLGLYARDARRSDEGGGRGGLFDVAMYEPLLALVAQRLATTARDGVDPGRNGNRFPTMAPRNVYPTADRGWVALTAGTDDLVKRLFAVIGRPELIEDPRFRDNRARVAHVDELDEIIGGWIAARTADETVRAFNAAGVSLAAVDNLKSVLRNPQFRARGSLIDVDAGGGAITTTAPLPRFAEEPGEIRFLGRDLGADNHAVYADWLGLSEAELEACRAARVI